MKIVNNLHGKYTNNIAHFYGVPYAYTNKDNVFKNKKEIKHMTKIINKVINIINIIIFFIN